VIENKKSPVHGPGIAELRYACLLVFLRYRNAQRDRPVFQGFVVSMMMVVCKPGIHIASQYIHIAGI
jgi:hypothetical protein